MAAIRPRMANRPITDDSGYVTAQLQSVTLTNEGKFENDQYEFSFNCEGKLASINLRLWTGVIVNDEQHDFTSANTKSKGKKQANYNKLTRLCIRLGLITEAELKTADEVRLMKLGNDLEALPGQMIRFKLMPTAKGLSQIDIDTIELILPESSPEGTKSKSGKV